jgi:hypothetical protein
LSPLSNGISAQAAVRQKESTKNAQPFRFSISPIVLFRIGHGARLDRKRSR